MGAFYLYHKEANVRVGSAKRIFAQKGFSNPKFFDFGKWKLLLYRKMLLNVNNFFEGGQSGHLLRWNIGL